jgi:hypothetical protein
LKRLVQDNRVVSAHRLVAAEHLRGFFPSLALLTTPKVFLGLRSPDGGPRQGKTRNDGVGSEKPGYLTERARSGTKQYSKRVKDFIKVVEFPSNVEYDDRRG